MALTNASNSAVNGEIKEKRSILLSAKYAESLETGELEEVDAITGERSTELVRKKRKVSTVEDESESDVEDEEAADDVADLDPTKQTADIPSLSPKMNRRQARQLQKDLQKAAKPKARASRGKQKSAKKPQKDSSLPNPDALDVNGLLEDLSHIEIDLTDSETELPTKLSATADVRKFFDNACSKKEGTNKIRKVHDCTICKHHRKAKHTFVSDLSTSRRHLQSEHKGAYRAWAKANKFVSMLPEDTEARRQAAKAPSTVQSALDDHVKPVEKAVPYSDNEFKQVAVEWLISSDQPLNAFEHPKFKAMIEVASRAKNGVNIPSGKVTRAEIIGLWYQHLRELKKRLNGDAVKGKVSLTCDGWQASNVDAYFAVTAHWIEEGLNGAWQLRSGLIGFTWLNSAHSRLRLGQALYKVALRVSIIAKIGHVSCDNASNNGTMMTEFARLIRKETGKPFDAKQRRIRCLAHVINLATQAMIKKYSSSKHYDPHHPNDHIPEEGVRDEIGLVRAICVKERSSSKRKDLFLQVQEKVAEENVTQAKRPELTGPPVGLLLDMPVRWSSTFAMLVRAYKLRKSVNRFVGELLCNEESTATRSKLMQLHVKPEEWARVKQFTLLLSYADVAQQMFSSDQYPTLALAIPALESLHQEWSKCMEDEKFAHFRPALAAALDTIKEYYDLTADCDAYTVSMVLDPCRKLQYFQKHWDSDLQNLACETMKDIFRAHYIEVYGDEDTAPQQKKNGGHRSSKIRRLIEVSDDESDPLPARSASETSGAPAWEREFYKYINSEDGMPDDMTLIAWWGINKHRYPVWASLASNYLAIMASSVSSERAFSSAGITITKRRNRLKADVVEALQGLKCALRRGLLIRDSGPSSVDEARIEADEEAEDLLQDAVTSLSGEKDDNTVVLELDLDSDTEEDY